MPPCPTLTRQGLNRPALLPALTLAFAMFSGSAAQAQTDPAGELKPFGPYFTTVQQAARPQARIYAYRPEDATSAWPVNLYINGRYHTSLLRGGFTELCTVAAQVNVQAALNDAQELHLGKKQTGVPLAPLAGQTLFLRVQETGARSVTLQTVSEAQATTQLRRTRLQQHTVSRAPEVQECQNAAPTPVAASATTAVAVPAPQPQREYALETDALFEFGKAELRASGFNAMEALIQKVQQDYNRIERIRVVGYTDAIGSAKVNKKLSQQRAQTVADHLRKRGLKPERGIQAEGRGSEELVKTGCQNAPTPVNKACHAPNRRVMIVVYGLRR